MANNMYICNLNLICLLEPLENKFDAADSLKIISDVIAKTKENLKEQSYGFLLWGWLIATASLLFFLLQQFTDFKLYFLPFPVLAVLGIILTINHYTRTQRAPETYIGYYLSRLWLVLGIGFILVVFISVVQKHPPFTYTLLMGGIGTLVTGLVLRFRPLVLGGILFLLLSGASIFLQDSYKPLLQGLAVLMGYLVPGYLLKNSKQGTEIHV